MKLCCLVLEILISVGVGLVAYFTDCDILTTGLIGASLFCLVEKISKITTSKGERIEWSKTKFRQK